MEKPHFLLNWCKQVSLSLLLAVIFLSDYCAQKHPEPGIWILVSGSVTDEKLYSSELLLAWPPVGQAGDPAARGVVSVGIIFSLLPQFASASHLFANAFNPVILPKSSWFSFSWDLRGQASHNSRLSKYAQWKLWAPEAAAALSHESVPAVPCQGCSTSLGVPFPHLSSYLVLGIQYSFIS